MQKLSKWDIALICIQCFLYVFCIALSGIYFFTGDRGAALTNVTFALLVAIAFFIDTHYHTEGGKYNREFFNYHVF